MWLLGCGLLACALFPTCGSERPAFSTATPRFAARVPVGTSAGGRAIVVTKWGTMGADHRTLVFGCIHGTECAGIPVGRRVQRANPPVHADVWVVPNLNPDGRALGTRLNGRGVDLNRNFPAAWRPIGVRWDPEYSGPRALSEPETRIARRLVRRFQPQMTVWFHQQSEPLVRAWGPSVRVARRYARLVGLPFRRMPWLDGTAPHWQNTAYDGTSSFVVELPLGPLSAADVARHARAILGLSGMAARGAAG
jgi:protein MpaA